MITHTVFFRLKHPAGSAEEKDFLAEALKLASLPGVGNFRCVKQVGKKNDFTHGLLMDFENDAAYQGYNDNPRHRGFVSGRWIPEVAAFMEIDYIS